MQVQAYPNGATRVTHTTATKKKPFSASVLVGSSGFPHSFITRDCHKIALNENNKNKINVLVDSMVLTSKQKLPSYQDILDVAHNFEKKLDDMSIAQFARTGCQALHVVPASIGSGFNKYRSFSFTIQRGAKKNTWYLVELEISTKFYGRKPSTLFQYSRKTCHDLVWNMLKHCTMGAFTECLIETYRVRQFLPHSSNETEESMRLIIDDFVTTLHKTRAQEYPLVESALTNLKVALKLSGDE